MLPDALLHRALGSSERVRRHGDLLQYAVTAAALLVLALWVGYQVLLGRYMFSALEMNDFGKFYYSTRLFLAGGDMYGPSPATAIPVGPYELQDFWNMNPPHFHLLLVPLAYLRPAWALAAWWTLSLAALAVSVRMIAAEADLRWTRRGVFWTVFWLTLLSPTSITVFTGQLSFLLMLPLTLAWRDARRGRWLRAAITLGAVASVKPFLGIFLAWLFWRRERAGVAMAATWMACLLGGLLVFGGDAYRAWLSVLASMNWSWVSLNGSITGLLSRTLSDSPRFLPFVDAPSVAWLLSLATFAGLGALSLVALSRDTTRHGTDRVFAGLLLTALVISPLGWIYYLLLAAGPLFLLWRSLPERPAPWRDRLIVMAVPGLVWPVAMTGLWRLTPWGAFTFGSIYAWTILALWGAVLLDQRAAARRCQEATGS